MTKQAVNPASLYASLELGFSHAVSSKGTVSVHCSGQVAWDKDKHVVGGDDIRLQARQALANLRVVLEAAGAQVSDAVQLRTYVVNHNPALLEPIGQAMAEFYADTMPAANTLIGVQALALPEFLIEIEAIAQIS